MCVHGLYTVNICKYLLDYSNLDNIQTIQETGFKAHGIHKVKGALSM